MALLPEHREFIRKIRDELWLQGVYWNKGRPSAFLNIIAPGIKNDASYMQRIEDDRVKDPNNMIDKDILFLQAIARNFKQPNSLFQDNFTGVDNLQEVVQNFIEKNYDKLPHIDKLDIFVIEKDSSQNEKTLLNIMKTQNSHLPKNLQNQFKSLGKQTEVATAALDELREKFHEEEKTDSHNSHELTIKWEIELLRAYIENQKGNKDEAIKKYHAIDWQRHRQRNINNEKQGDTGLLKKIKEFVLDMRIDDKLSWSNQDLFYLITTNLDYSKKRLGSLSNWLKDETRSYIDDNVLKNNIASTLGFDSQLWLNWENDELETDDIIYDCVERLKTDYENNKPKTKITFSGALSKYAKIPDPQKAILSELESSSTSSEIKDIIGSKTELFSKKHENQIFLLKASEILYNKAEYTLLNDHIILNLFENIQAKPEVRYLKAMIYSSDQFNNPEEAYKIIEDLFDEDEYEDHQTIILSNALRDELPNFSDEKYRKKTLIKLTENYQTAFNESHDYYPGINFAYMLSLVQELYPKAKLNNTSVQEVSIVDIYNDSKKSLEIHQNSHTPERLSKNFAKNTTFEKISNDLELPIDFIIKYIKNAKLTLTDDLFRNISENSTIPLPYAQMMKTAIRNRSNRYWAFISEYEFDALRNAYDDIAQEELFTRMSDLQPKKDPLSRTLRQLDFYVDTLKNGNKQPNESITRLMKDLNTLIT